MEGNMVFNLKFIILDTKDLGFYICNIDKVPEVKEYYSFTSIPFFGFFVGGDLSDSQKGGMNIDSKIDSFVQSCKGKGLQEKIQTGSNTSQENQSTF